MPRKYWTHNEIIALREAVSEGATDAEIADELGRTPDSVYSKRVRLKLRSRRQGRPPDVHARAEVMEMVANGLSLSQIARQRGVHSSNVAKMVRSLQRDKLLSRTGGNTCTCRYVLR